MNIHESFAALLLAQVTNTPPSAVENWTKANPWPTAVAIIAIVGLLIAAAIFLRSRDKEPQQPPGDDSFRHVVARSVLFSALWGLVALAALAILMPGAAREPFNVLLPVFGTWVGTLLAYYFGKDNYESGARNSANLAKALTGMDKLRSIPVTQPGIMISIDKIDIPALLRGKKMNEFGQVNLKDMVVQMKRQRLPLINPDTGAAFGIVHKSLLTDFLVKQEPAKFATTSLQDLLNDPEAGVFAKNSFVVVQNTATLADVKERMMQQTQSTGASCEDAFITPPGNARVEGWITSDIIDQNSRV